MQGRVELLSREKHRSLFRDGGREKEGLQGAEVGRRGLKLRSIVMAGADC